MSKSRRRLKHWLRRLREGAVGGLRQLATSHTRHVLPCGSAPLLEPLESRLLLSAGDLPGSIVINEIMYHPSSENSAEEYIELFNRTGAAVNVDGWQFTSGISFTLPNVSIASGGYLVVAADVAAFSAKYPSVTNVVGGWTGELSDRSEEIELVDGAGTRIDRVTYADEGDWAMRARGPLSFGHQGWTWVADHDGLGRSLELINVNLTNDFGANWATSALVQGSPGAVNGLISSNIAPIIVDIEQVPAIPRSSDPVTITARLVDELTTGLTATLRWRVDGSPTFDSLVMFDDGLHGDGAAGDRVFGATIAPQANNVVVEFYVEGRDAASQLRTWPAPVLGGGQQANALYQVDDSFDPNAAWVPGSQPVYRLIMTDAERAELATIGSNSSQSDSNAEMNGTFISIDGVDTKVRYQVGIRNRGHGSRLGPPNNYRVNFAHDQPWKDVVRININSRYPQAQLLGSVIRQLAGQESADATGIQLRINGQNLAQTGSLMFGSYVVNEALDSDYADNHFPLDPKGNLYVVHDDDITGDGGNLKYEGTDPDAYRNTYFKGTNEEDDDWSDLIHLTDVLNNAPNEGYLDALRGVIDVEQWLRYIALDSLLGNLEGGLTSGTGDDFAFYRGVNDPRFVLVPYDLDTILTIGGSTPNPNRGIFTGYVNNPGLTRLLTHPDLVGLYYQAFVDLIAEFYNPQTLNPVIDQVLEGFVPQASRDSVKQFIEDRVASVLSQIPRSFTITSGLTQVDDYFRTTSPSVALNGTADTVKTQSVLVNGLPATYNATTGAWSISSTSGASQTLVQQGSTWKYLDNGSNQGTAWRASAFNDSAWASGPAQLGYGDGDEATVINGGPSGSRFITSYFRQSFNVANPASFTDLTLRLKRDDGAVVYLNGVEIARSNMPGGTIISSTPASNSVGNADETTFFNFSINPSQLLAGNNVLAVEVHQIDSASSDVSFDLELLGQTLSSASGGVPLNPGVNRVLVQAFDQKHGNGNEVTRGTIDIWYDGAGSAAIAPWSGPVEIESLGMVTPSGYLPGVAMLVDLSAFDVNGDVEKDLWDGIATLTSDRDDIIISTHELQLYNGRGSALITISGTGTNGLYGDGSFNLTATLGTHTVTKQITSLVGVAQTTVSGTLPGSATTWSGVVHVTGDVIVPVGHTLTIEPGTLVILDGTAALLSTTGTDIDVRGTLNSLGTKDNPVTFTATSIDAPWGEIRHINAQPSLYLYTQITRAGHSPRGGHTNTGPALRPTGSTITFDHAAITDSAGKIMQSTAGSNLTFLHTLISRAVMGPEIEGTALLFEDSMITDTLGIYREDGITDDDDAIYIHDQLAGQTVTIRRSVFAHGDDDGIDTLNAIATIEDVIVRDWVNPSEDAKGISVNGGQVSISRALIVNSLVGISSKNNVGGGTAVTTINRSTILATQTGVQRVGSSAGIQTTVTNSIVQAPDALDGELNPAALLVTYTNANETFTGTGNINASPLFVDPLAGNYRLSAGSPSVNAGNPAAPLDADGSRADQGLYGDGFAGTLAVSSSLSGNITTNIVLSPQNGPYTVTGNVTVAVGATLTILPGTTVFFSNGTSITINGRLVAEGTELEQIRFTRLPVQGSTATWNGLQFINTTQDNRITWAILEHARTNNGSVGLSGANLTIDHVTFDKTDRRRIESNNSSLIVRNSTFTTIFAPGVAPTSDNLSEHIHGGGVPVGGHVIIENNFFGHITGHNDSIDFDGVINQGRVVVIRGNTFSGGGDDALDLTGDFLIEGNVFSHFHKDQFNTDPGESNNISASGGTFTIVRNVFYDLDHVAIIKEGAFATFTNNTVYDIDFAALYFDLAGQTSGPGLGANVESSIFVNVASLFGAVTTQNPTVNRSIVPASNVGLGIGNSSENPRLTDPVTGDMTLMPGSPALGSGRGGIDMGALVPAGAHISGGPTDLSPSANATFTITGPGITHYRVSIDGGAFGAAIPIATLLQFNGLSNGTHTIRVIGRDAAGIDQSEADAATRTWTINTALKRIIINEVMAANNGVLNHNGTFPDAIELYNAGAVAVNLAGMSISDKLNNPTKFVFPSNTILNPGEYLVLFADNPNGTPGLHLGFSLDGDGEGVFLFDSVANGQTLLDSVEFGPQIPDLSIGRIGPAQEWTLTQPTFGSSNIAQRLGDASQLRLNEWGVNGNVRFVDDFLELYNIDNLPVALGGLTVSDKPANQPTLHTIAPLSFIAGEGFYSFTADGKKSSGPNHLDFNLSSDRGFLGLFAADQSPIDLIHYGPQTEDVTHGRLPNGGDSLVFFALPTPGSANTVIQPQILNLVTYDNTWKFNDTNTNLNTAWRAAAFNDASWNSGAGLLGFENDPLPQPLVTALTTGRITYYFRTHFNLPVDPALVTLELSTIIDDGAVIYLNGQELHRVGFNAGTNVTFTTLADRNVGNASVEGAFIVPATLLVQGDNVIAVEVHQTSAGSGDMVFGLELKATVAPVTQVTADNLRISEVQYNPLGGDDFEFLELINISGETINLSGAAITLGVQFNFSNSAITQLAPGQRIVVVKNLAAFESRYGTGLPVAGEYGGSLDDNGEEIVIVNTLNQIILQFEYNDTGKWPSRADGGGSSLEVIDPFTTIDFNDPDAWRSSSEVHGTPGAAGLGPDNRIVFNEVLSHTDLPLLDSLELYNTTGNLIDIGGWFISDSAGNLGKYRIPNGTAIGPGGYLVFDEDDFNPGDGTLPNDFALDAALGDSAYLVQADPITGKLLRFVDVVSFGAQANGESWGRYPNGDGDLMPMIARTLGAVNSLPRIGPLYISEIMYNPPLPAGGLPAGVTLDDLEYIEIFNNTPVTFTQVMTEWRIRGGIDFDFPAGHHIDKNHARIIVSFDPTDPLNATKLATFLNVYGLSPATPLLGPYTGKLANEGEEIRLERPDEPPAEDLTFFPRLLEDRVEYGDAFPWPTTPDGEGNSLQRRRADLGHGAFVTSWYANAPSPGTVSNDVTAPRISMFQLDSTHWSPAFRASLAAQTQGTAGYRLWISPITDLLPLPWTDVNILTIQFTENVLIDSSYLTIVGASSGQSAIAAYNYDTVNRIASWTFLSNLVDDKWLIHLSDSTLDHAGNPLDGETGVSAVGVTGNGIAGGDLLYHFSVLPGDVDGDGVVTTVDADAVRAVQFKTTTDAGYLPKYDINGSGRIQIDDLILVRNELNNTLPADPPVIEAPVAVSTDPVEVQEVGTLPIEVDDSSPDPEQDPDADHQDGTEIPIPDRSLLAALFSLVKERGTAANPHATVNRMERAATRIEKTAIHMMHQMPAIWSYDSTRYQLFAVKPAETGPMQKLLHHRAAE